MRIVFLTRLFYPHIGGVEKHVFEVSKNLLQKGHTVTVVTEQHDKKLPLYETYKHITIYRIPINTSERRKKIVIWLWMIRNMSLLQNADVIHCHDVFFWYLPFRFSFPYKKVYTTFHGYEGNIIPQKKAHYMHKLAEILSTGNLCIGDFFEKWYKTKPTAISYGAVDMPRDSIMHIRKHNTLRAVFLGRLEEETGIMIYLKALEKLKTKPIILDVLGDGSLRNVCEAYVKKNKLSVTFHGFIKDPEPFIKQSDVMFVSRYLSILEAFSHKKYVFAVYNNHIKKDYLSMTPFAKLITIAGNENELVTALNEFNIDKKNKKIEKAFHWVKNQSWRKMVNNYLALWSKEIRR